MTQSAVRVWPGTRPRPIASSRALRPAIHRSVGLAARAHGRWPPAPWRVAPSPAFSTAPGNPALGGFLRRTLPVHSRNPPKARFPSPSFLIVPDIQAIQPDRDEYDSLRHGALRAPAKEHPFIILSAAKNPIGEANALQGCECP